MNNSNLTVYENHTFELTKYPRVYTEKENTDKVIITFLLHEKKLKEIYQSMISAIKLHNECKEYYYLFRFNNLSKKYNARDIITLLNSNNFEKDDIDTYYKLYIKIYPFYMNLFDSIEQAKKSHFECKDFIYRVVPPNNIYRNIKSQVYTGIELMELNVFTQFLKNNNYIQDLPQNIIN